MTDKFYIHTNIGKFSGDKAFDTPEERVLVDTDKKVIYHIPREQIVCLESHRDDFDKWLEWLLDKSNKNVEREEKETEKRFQHEMIQ